MTLNFRLHKNSDTLMFCPASCFIQNRPSGPFLF